MSRRNRITNAKAQKLRSGHTFWRCQIQQDGTVYVHEEFLKGSKFISVMRSMFPESVPEKKRKVLYVSMKIGPKDPEKWTRCSHLSSVNPGSSINTFTTRRAAQRWKREVEAGRHSQAVADAMEHWDFCNSMSDMHDDYYRDDPFDDYGPDDYYDDYDDPHSEVVASEPLYSEPMTLGELLRKKLEEKNPYDVNDDTFPEESYVGTDVKPLMDIGEATSRTVRRLRRVLV